MTSDKPENTTEIHNKVRTEWAQVSASWPRFEPRIHTFMTPVTIRMLAATQPAEGDHVLDVGTGIGEPALSVAQLVGATGRVLGIDLVEEMISAARTRAEVLGLSNAEFEVAGLENYAVADESFDIVLSRFGLIFSADIHWTLRRLFTLLKPGGRIALSTWCLGPQNAAFHITQTAVHAELNESPPDPGASGPFCLAEEGQLVDALRRTGFTSAAQAEVRSYQFAGSVEDYWRNVQQMSPRLQRQLKRFSRDQFARVESRILHDLKQYEVAGVVRVPGRSWVGWATKPPVPAQ